MSDPETYLEAVAGAILNMGCEGLGCYLAIRRSGPWSVLVHGDSKSDPSPRLVAHLTSHIGPSFIKREATRNIHELHGRYGHYAAW